MDDAAFQRIRNTLGDLIPLHNSEMLTSLQSLTHTQPISSYWQCNEPWRDELTLSESYWAVETARRASHLILALDAWKLKHGSLPKSLDELVGPYLDQVPIDPYSRDRFLYFRTGLKNPLHWKQSLWGWWRTTATGDLPANEPFIWSTGMNVGIGGPTGTRSGTLGQYYIQLNLPYETPHRPNARTRTPNSEYDIWESGWPFPIP